VYDESKHTHISRTRTLQIPPKNGYNENEKKSEKGSYREGKVQVHVHAIKKAPKVPMSVTSVMHACVREKDIKVNQKPVDHRAAGG
jgi:hypothetical protein